MRVLPQQEHCNLGEVDDDRTPDMRTPPAATRGDLDSFGSVEPELSMNEPDTHAIKREKEF